MTQSENSAKTSGQIELVMNPKVHPGKEIAADNENQNHPQLMANSGNHGAEVFEFAR